MKKENYLLVFVLIASILSFASCQKSDNAVGRKEAALSVIHSRKSVRNFIKERPIEKQDIETLLKAGMAAPSGMDTRPWEFIVIDDRATLDRMAEALSSAKMLSEAPAAIIVCGDTVRSSYWYLDCSAAIENILLAAEALDLGAVWTASYPYRDRMQVVIDNTNMPSQVLPLAVIPVGYPKGQQTPKNKFDASKIHLNKW